MTLGRESVFTALIFQRGDLCAFASFWSLMELSMDFTYKNTYCFLLNYFLFIFFYITLYDI